MIKIVTDSTNDLSKEMLEQLDIEVIPLFVNFGEESYLDGVEIDINKLYTMVKERNELPKTAAAPIPTIEECFQKWVDQGYDVIYTGISRQMSRTFENAYMAAQSVDPEHCYVVDSMNLSTGIGLLLLKACKYRDQGLDAYTIVKNLERDRHLVLSQFAIEKMDHLHKGGRCSGMTAMLGTVLNIKPIIAVREGKMHVQKKPIGMKKALDTLMKQIIQDKERLDLDHILLTHSKADKSNEYLLKKLKEEFPDVDIINTVAGCVISTHCGEGTIGILYMVKPE